MAITRIKVRNFKSFDELDLELDNFSVLVGPNASGKSNFIQIFRFLRDIATSGLVNAISLQGGVEYLRNIHLGYSRNLSIEVTSNFDIGLIGKRIKREIIGIRTSESIYNFELKFNKRGSGFEIINDKILIRCRFVKLKEIKNKKLQETEDIGGGYITIRCTKGRIYTEIKAPEEIQIIKEDIFPPFLFKEKQPPKTLLLENPFIIPNPFEAIFRHTAIYDFDPKLPKNATSVTGKAELEEDGRNLSIVLNKLIEDKEKKRKLFNLLNDLLPYLSDISVEKFADKSLLFKLKETYYKKQYLPGSLISDGTINITALIIALYFEEKIFTIIEEPERNIHPFLISRVVEMMKDASRNKQIIVTTHNPEIVKYAGENLLLVSRDDKGFSRIVKPAEKEEIKIFLKNEIGIDELFVQDLLGV